MYKNFFGFKERPFQLVPNPAYWFLSRSHEEAMAHLSYAISQGDGFVEITGEVGTGKTTLCRAFLETLDNNHEAAYIFNPNLNSLQLIKAINDEFGISSDSDDAKVLTDALNSFLMEKRAEGKKVILVIDEAQNLSKEVLEQLRLLSNLETSTSKLLQIILVGQPELGEMLDSHELRQLGQRITMSCYLSPLTFRETKNYIQHRINIASKKKGITFTRGALRYIYKYSGGIPRLINVACDRTLLTAFGLDRHKITGVIARASIKELAGRGGMNRLSLLEGANGMVLLSVLLLVLVGVILYKPEPLDLNKLFGHSQRQKPTASAPKKAAVKMLVRPVPEKAAVNAREEKAEKISPEKGVVKAREEKAENISPEKGAVKTRVEEAGKPAPEGGVFETRGKKVENRVPDPKARKDINDLLSRMDTHSSRHTAFKAALDMWSSDSRISQQLDEMEDDQTFFRLAAKQNGLLMRPVEGSLNLVRRLNLPAILEFYLPGVPSPRYVTLSKISNGKMTLRGGAGNDLIDVESTELEPYWSGRAYILWKHFYDYRGTIPMDAPGDSIVALKMLMKDIGYKEIELSPVYDERTREAVKEIQRRHGLLDDGIVGPLTKIAIYNENKSLKIPRLTGD